MYDERGACEAAYPNEPKFAAYFCRMILNSSALVFQMNLQLLESQRIVRLEGDASQYYRFTLQTHDNRHDYLFGAMRFGDLRRIWSMLDTLRSAMSHGGKYWKTLAAAYALRCFNSKMVFVTVGHDDAPVLVFKQAG